MLRLSGAGERGGRLRARGGAAERAGGGARLFSEFSESPNVCRLTEHFFGVRRKGDGFTIPNCVELLSEFERIAGGVVDRAALA